MTSCVHINPSHRLNGYVSSFEQSLVSFNTKFSFMCDMLSGESDDYIQTQMEKDLVRLKQDQSEINRVFSVVESYQIKRCGLFTNFAQITIKMVEFVLVFLGLVVILYSINSGEGGDGLINVTDEEYLLDALLCKYGTVTFLVGWILGQFGHYSLLRMLCLQKSQRIFSKVLNNHCLVELSANICQIAERVVNQDKAKQERHVQAASSTLVISLKELKSGFSLRFESEFCGEGACDNVVVDVKRAE